MTKLKLKLNGSEIVSINLINWEAYFCFICKHYSLSLAFEFTIIHAVFLKIYKFMETIGLLFRKLIYYGKLKY